MTATKPLKAKLLFAQFIAIIPLLLFIFYVFDLWYDTARSRVLDNSINQAKLVANTVTESLNLGVSVSTILAIDPNLKNRYKAKSDFVDDNLKSITANIKEIASMSVTDLSGKVIMYSRELTPQQKEITLADRDYFQTLLTTKKTVVSDPLLSRYRGLPTVIMASPMMENDKVIAVVTSSYDLPILKQKLEKVIKLETESIILLYDKNGRLVFILNKPLPTEEEKTVFNNLSYMTNKDRNKINIIENQKLPLSDKLYLGASVPVEDFGWTVVNLEPMTDIFAPLYKIQSITWLILLSALLFALSIISYILRKIKMVY